MGDGHEGDNKLYDKVVETVGPDIVFLYAARLVNAECERDPEVAAKLTKAIQKTGEFVETLGLNQSQVLVLFSYLKDRLAVAISDKVGGDARDQFIAEQVSSRSLESN